MIRHFKLILLGMSVAAVLVAMALGLGVVLHDPVLRHMFGWTVFWVISLCLCYALGTIVDEVLAIRRRRQQ